MCLVRVCGWLGCCLVVCALICPRPVHGRPPGSVQSNLPAAHALPPHRHPQVHVGRDGQGPADHQAARPGAGAAAAAGDPGRPAARPCRGEGLGSGRCTLLLRAAQRSACIAAAAQRSATRYLGQQASLRLTLLHMAAFTGCPSVEARKTHASPTVPPRGPTCGAGVHCLARARGAARGCARCGAAARRPLALPARPDDEHRPCHRSACSAAHAVHAMAASRRVGGAHVVLCRMGGIGKWPSGLAAGTPPTGLTSRTCDALCVPSPCVHPQGTPGRSSPARLRPRCWRGTRTTTTGATSRSQVGCG